MSFPKESASISGNFRRVEYERAHLERILHFEEALAQVLQHAANPHPAGKEEWLPLLEAAGRTLAVEVRAGRDQPPFPRSTRDGFAVWSGDLGLGRDLQVVGSVRAGEAWIGPELSSGQALEIMTGAPMPAGADAVLMVEHAARDGNTLCQNPDRTLRAGENVVAQGAEARAGQELIPVGQRIGAAEVALAAACGDAHLVVYLRPRVAIIATGDELLELPELPTSSADQQAPEPSQIYNSNSYALAALVGEAGGEPVRLPIARDNVEDLRARLEDAREHDLILFSGGVSMGRYDLVEPVLAEAGAEFFFTGALIQPGKPVVFGRLSRKGKTTEQAGESAGQWTYFFGLPGNPVSTEVCFRLFVAPFVRALAGQTEVAPRFAEARLAQEVRGGAKVTRFLPAEVRSDWQNVTIRPIAWQGSGDLAANGRANGFVVLPAGVEHFPAGEAVRVLLR